MNTRDMVGPAGVGGCSVMNCLHSAVVEKLFEVAHPYQENRRLLYRFCDGHKERGFDPWQYPNYKLISTRSLQ